MGIILKHIKVCELIDFCNSDSYKELVFVPISQSRALSYANNPKADKDDTALILAYENQKLIGYLGMFTDRINHLQKEIKFCWFSCMWVLPEYRRSGISIQLLKEGYTVFNGFVMITNYIPQSKAAFIKTGQYEELEILNGYRFYIKFDIKNILTRKYPKAKYFKWLLSTIDAVSNSMTTIVFNRKPTILTTDYSFDIIDSIEEKTSMFIDEFAERSLFQRKAEEFKWMTKYPWISEHKNASIDYSKYYFSQYCSDFRQWYIKIRNKQGNLIGFIILTRHKGELKIPYFFISEDINQDLGVFIAGFTKKNNIRTIITYNQSLIKAITKKKNYLFKRKSGYGFLASQNMFMFLKQIRKPIYDGDGDGAFT